MVRASITCSVLVVFAAVCSAAAATPCRDRLKHPFDSASVWNTAIGSDAELYPAGIYTAQLQASGGDCAVAAADVGRVKACPGAAAAVSPSACRALGCCFDAAVPGSCFQAAGGPPQSFHIDADYFFATTAADPLTPWVGQGSWGPVNHCAVVGDVKAHIPFPENFTNCATGNNGAGILMPDNVTLLQMQPLYRAAPGSPILARYKEGSPVPSPYSVSILGNGTLGAHGGSGLSATGGTIRAGELNATSPPIQHALKIELFAHQYYYAGDPCWRWPAVGCDGYAHDKTSGMRYGGVNKYLGPGSLLAIPASVASAVNVTTVPGAKLRDALTTYGAYVVDDTADDTGCLCGEAIVSRELKEEYNITFGTYHDGVAAPGTAMYNDLAALFQALHVVINNSPRSVGGGGTPLAPPAPPICGT